MTQPEPLVEPLVEQPVEQPAEEPGAFLLGVGCQKGGTAWMHRYLDASPQSDLGFRKEYHVWDGLDLPTGRLARERVEQQAARGASPDAARRVGFYRAPSTYFEYFTALLAQPSVRLTADITPGYAGLSENRLTMVRDGFADRGVRTVTVFLLRDPVERIWSAARMDLQRGGDVTAEAEVELITRMHNNPMYADRTRYELTMDRLEHVFAPADIYYGFFERLFDARTLRGLCGFLGIDFHEPDLGRQVNVSPKHLDTLPAELVARVAQHFAPTYAAVAARFPDLDLDELWPSSRLL